MEFCSKYGYDYGFNGSDSEEISDEEGDTEVKTRRRYRRADPNIISVKFDTLVKPAEMQAGEPIVCTGCEAFMSMQSKNNVENLIWSCEFCGTKNSIPTFVEEQLPKSDDVTYLIEPAVQKPESDNNDKQASPAKSLDDNYLIFCTDVSGSMDTHLGNRMTRLDAIKVACVENLEKLKAEEPKKRVGLVTFSSEVKFFGDCKRSQPIVTASENSGSGSLFAQRQYIRPSKVKMQNVVPVQQQQSNQSFFNSMKLKANNIFSLGKQSKSKAGPPESDSESRSNQGRRSQSEEEIQQEKNKNDIDYLNNKEEMMKLGEGQDGNLRGVADSVQDIKAHIKKMRTEGATALGPGLVFSIGFASKKSGSQIILCTDGAANVGMGNLGNSFNRSLNTSADKFYEDLAEDALKKNLVVNVISMEGTDCKLALLGKVADKTNGTLNVVNPMNLTDEFRSILENRLVATNVEIKLIVNKKYIYIRDEELEIAESKAIEANDMAKKEQLNELKKSKLIKEIGNANIDTEITFEYGIRKLKNSEKEERLKKLPFQLQVTYTGEDGSRAVRVYTKCQEFTSDRQQAELNLVSEDILWMNAGQKMSSHFMGSNNVVAKYKGRQMKNYQQKNTRLTEAPEQFQQQAMIIEQSSKSRNISSLGDLEAREMFQAKKMNRRKMNKK